MINLIKPVYAAINNPLIKNADQQNSHPEAFFNNFLAGVFSIFMTVGVIYFLWHFIMGGYHFIASEGDPKNIDTSKKELTYALLGLAIVFSVFGILKVVGLVFGIQGLNQLKITWPSL